MFILKCFVKLNTVIVKKGIQNNCITKKFSKFLFLNVAK